MEIIHSGKNIYSHTCSKCNCVFAYGKLDVEQRADHPNSYQPIVKCPECNSEEVVTFKERDYIFD